MIQGVDLSNVKNNFDEQHNNYTVSIGDISDVGNVHAATRDNIIPNDSEIIHDFLTDGLLPVCIEKLNFPESRAEESFAKDLGEDLVRELVANISSETSHGQIRIQSPSTREGKITLLNEDMAELSETKFNTSG